LRRARVFRAHGVRRLLPANQLVDPVGLAWLRAELDSDPEIWMACLVDSPEGAALLAGDRRSGRASMCTWRSAPPVAGSLRVSAQNDQHALVHGPDLRIGDTTGFGISHPCTTADNWRLMPVLHADLRVVDCVRTCF
jgi:D-serine deaminase-like pyridoxal phosphate-dependent protein